jgi:hypothetical protein
MTLFGEQAYPHSTIGPRHAREGPSTDWGAMGEKVKDLGLNGAAYLAALVATAATVAGAADAIEQLVGDAQATPREYEILTAGHGTFMDMVGQISAEQAVFGIDWRVDFAVAAASGLVAVLLVTRPQPR